MALSHDSCAVLLNFAEPWRNSIEEALFFNLLLNWGFDFFISDKIFTFEIVHIVWPFLVNQYLETFESPVEGITEYLDHRCHDWCDTQAILAVDKHVGSRTSEQVGGLLACLEDVFDEADPLCLRNTGHKVFFRFLEHFEDETANVGVASLYLNAGNVEWVGSDLLVIRILEATLLGLLWPCWKDMQFVVFGSLAF